jgi:hypothetical protein
MTVTLFCKRQLHVGGRCRTLLILVCLAILATFANIIIPRTTTIRVMLNTNSKTNPPSLDKTRLAQEMEARGVLQKQMKDIAKNHHFEMEDTKATTAPVLTEKEETVVNLQKQLQQVKTKDITLIELKQPAATTADNLEIPRNPNATIASDVASIYHFPGQSNVVVNFHAQARCPRPYLVGRLSGAALIRLHWTWSRERLDDISNNTPATVMLGTYHAPVTGEYFLEIIVIHCKDFAYGVEVAFEDGNATSSTTLNATGDVNPLSFDFKSYCVEDPFNSQITDKAASILVEKQSEKPLQGFWRKAAAVETPLPVYTRFQPPICYEDYKAKRNLSQVCLEQPSLDQFLNYEFEWSPSLKLNTSVLRQANPTTVCYAGYSHARTLVEAASRVGLNHTNNNVDIKWIESRYPEDVTKQTSVLQRMNCSSLVIGIVQWPASFDRHHPTKLGQYYQELKGMVLRLLQERPGMMLFFRSVHTNPLDRRSMVCPPKDWRNPTAMNGYNEVIQHVCREMNITFLDATFLTAPVWDAAPDYSHLDNRTSDAELLFLTGSALGVVVDGKVKAGLPEEIA